MPFEEILKVNRLTVKYRDVVAVNDVSFTVRENEVFGIIGANGAGKTSLVEAIEGLRQPHSGEISLLGLHPQKDRLKLFAQTGVQLQQTTYPDHAKVGDVCRLFSSFYDRPLPYEELLTSLGIGDTKKKYIHKLSGGQRQKLSIVLSLLCRPKIVFWDELTTGLDPLSRHDLYETIAQYKRDGLTIVLVTHFMEEVEKLCDRVALMKDGRMLQIGTPGEIKKAYGAETLDEVFLRLSGLVDSAAKQKKKEGLS